MEPSILACCKLGNLLSSNSFLSCDVRLSNRILFTNCDYYFMYCSKIIYIISKPSLPKHNTLMCLPHDADKQYLYILLQQPLLAADHYGSQNVDIEH
ncbi:hypothetical protein Xvie_02688 [Xenorhabdus vietnamensis]|uniref:Uncharacterized protein n=1 Tax=Xenorhabdus vietnamensis TaxID=351656 RepID=A0A1Y2SAG7_9GAMM|nr:hypothetical protein Xvie_02688 [Xenorhabdus vietnamensis]